jgi:hypothetical protein
MVHPNILPSSLVESAQGAAPHPARVEYLATLGRHSAAVNVVRFSPNGTRFVHALRSPDSITNAPLGELIASAGDGRTLKILRRL